MMKSGGRVSVKHSSEWVQPKLKGKQSRQYSTLEISWPLISQLENVMCMKGEDFQPLALQTQTSWLLCLLPTTILPPPRIQGREKVKAWFGACQSFSCLFSVLWKGIIFVIKKTYEHIRNLYQWIKDIEVVVRGWYWGY